MAVGFYVVEYATKPNNQPWDAEILCYSSGPPADAQNLIGAVRFFRDSSRGARRQRRREACLELPASEFPGCHVYFSE